MSVNLVIQPLADLVRIHQQLNKYGLEKVELIKQGKMSDLEALVREETKLVHKLRMTEVIREKQVTAYFQEQGLVTEDATISRLIDFVSEEEKQLLQKLQIALLQEVNQLKTQNELNQSLIEESLRFVNLSLDLLVPHSDDISYKRPHQREEDIHLHKQSIFDSKI